MEATIKTLSELKKRATGVYLDIYIKLNFGIRSSKQIFYNKQNKTFDIFNNIDGSQQTVTEEQLKTETNIFDAIKKRLLIAE